LKNGRTESVVVVGCSFQFEVVYACIWGDLLLTMKPQRKPTVAHVDRNT